MALAGLRGRVVLLHFWRYGCVASLRQLEELRPLEEVFADELVVVGVHSPKFPAESDHRAVRQAVARHRLRHPVLDDADLANWQRYGASSWPTLVVVDPEGFVAGSVAGTGSRAMLERAVEALVAEHEGKGTLRRGDAGLFWSAPPSGSLAFPGKVAVSPDGLRLAIADTGHDQVLVCSVDGLLLSVHTGFRQPQGVRFDDDGVVVCDTGADRVIRSTGEAVVDGIAAPWDLASDGEAWVVAEAGGHRLRRIRPRDLSARPLAGTGGEGLADGPPVRAVLAQPSGVARTDGGIVFVDAESSALRLLATSGGVTTLVGSGLADWGRSDGPGDVAQLQHPLGVAAAPDGRVYVADTFNSLLRVWQDGALRTLPAEGLDEPGGLDVLADGRLVVADTNNHRVVVVDPGTGAVEPVDIDESWLFAYDATGLHAVAGAGLRVPVTAGPDGGGVEGTDAAPVRVTVEARPPGLLAPGPQRWDLDGPGDGVEVRAGRPGGGFLLVEAAIGVRGRRPRVHRRRHPLRVVPRG